MGRRVRGMGIAVGIAALAIGLAACGSSGSEAGDVATTAAAAPTTTDGTATTAAPTPTTAAAELDGLPSCQEILQQYADTFTMDDLAPTAALFRQWAPFMPDDVAEASISLAEAYEAAGDGSGLDMASVDLSADATTFSDWTNEGCPAG